LFASSEDLMILWVIFGNGKYFFFHKLFWLGFLNKFYKLDGLNGNFLIVILIDIHARIQCYAIAMFCRLILNLTVVLSAIKCKCKCQQKKIKNLIPLIISKIFNYKIKWQSKIRNKNKEIFFVNKSFFSIYIWLIFIIIYCYLIIFINWNLINKFN